MNLTPLFPNLSRACEIALVCNLPIYIYVNKDEYSYFDFDFHLITQHFKNNIFVLTEHENSINIEITKPNVNLVVLKNENQKEYDTYNNIIQRAEEAKNNYLSNYNLCESSHAILKAAYDRLDLCINDIYKIKKIAIAIAGLEKSKLIEPTHVAEAINYIAHYAD